MYKMSEEGLTLIHCMYQDKKESIHQGQHITVFNLFEVAWPKKLYLGFKRGGPKCGLTIFGSEW